VSARVCPDKSEVMVNGPDVVYMERKEWIEKVAGSPAGCYPCGSRRGLVAFDLPELVNGTVDVAPVSADLDVGLIDLPLVSDGVPTGPSSLGQQWREPLDPAVDRDVVDLDTTVGEKFLDVAVGQAEAQVPADRDDDHVGREAEAREGGPWNWSAARGGGFSCRQSRCSETVTANATTPGDPVEVAE
jgi:hypothetical protein